MIVFLADRFSAAFVDIDAAYEVTQREWPAGRGRLYRGPHVVPPEEDFVVVTTPDRLRGHRNFTYVTLPSAAYNTKINEMIDLALASGGREECYPMKNSA